jgi:outer membrane protein TolC
MVLACYLYIYFCNYMINMMKVFYCFLVFVTAFAVNAGCQEILRLTVERAVGIALEGSYTVKSNDGERKVMQSEYLYFKAQFLPRIDLNIFSPSWNEAVSAVEQTNDLPVYNSTSSVRFGSDLKFTYVLPTGGNVALTGNVYHENLRTVFAGDYSSRSRRQAYSRFGLVFEQPVFTRNRLKENLLSARFQYERAELFFTRTQMDIVYNVTKGFYEVYRSAFERDMCSVQLDNAREALRTARLKFETGNIPEGDLMVTEIMALQCEAALSESSAKYESLKDEFKLLAGIGMEIDIEVVAVMDFEPVVIDLDVAVGQALGNRLELKESEYDIGLQRIEIDRARREREVSGNIGAYYDFTGLGTAGGDVGELFRSSFDNFAMRPPNRGVTFTLSVPIADWGRGRHKVKSQLIRLGEKELAREDAERRIVKEIREIARTVDGAEKRFRINGRNRDNAANSYRIARLRFENGDISGQELAAEQDRLSKVEMAYIDAYITYRLALADLKRRTMWDFENGRSYRMVGD